MVMDSGLAGTRSQSLRRLRTLACACRAPNDENQRERLASLPLSARERSESRPGLPLSADGRAKSLLESIEIGCRDVGDRPIGHAVIGPGDNIVAGNLLLGHRGRPAGGDFAEADQVLAAAIDQRWDGRASDHVDAAADQRKAFAREIDDARSLGNAAVEPGLDG